MDHHANGDLEEPEQIRGPEGQRRDGRPTDDAMGQPSPDSGDGAAPTVAPEETGGAPSTEHAPGADL